MIELNEQEIQRVLRTMRRLYRDRMVASRMALGFLNEGITGASAELPDSLNGKHTIPRLAELVRPQSEHSAQNVMRRAWPQTRPVLHLATAFQVMALWRTDQPDVGFDLDNLAFDGTTVELAQVHEKLILADPRCGAGEDHPGADSADGRLSEF